MLLPFLAAAMSLSLAQERTPPVFQADVRLIRLDVSAVDRAGRAVAGLRPEDFRVTEDGRPMEITYFEAIEGGASVAPGGVLEAARPVAERRILLLVDTAAMTMGQRIRARQGTARYIREATVDGDWVRLVNLATGRAWDGQIPEDRLRLEFAAQSLALGPAMWANAGGASDGIESHVETAGEPGLASEAETSGAFLSMFAQTSGLLGSLESLLVQLGAVEGRKALVLVSPGFPQLRDFDRRLERLADLAREAATAIYFVDAAGLDGLLPESGSRMLSIFDLAWSRSGGAQDLAEATGGFAARFSNSLVPALSRIGGEMRTYYVLGYVPPRADDGRFRSVKVKVDVHGVTVRTKRGYLAGPPRR